MGHRRPVLVARFLGLFLSLFLLGCGGASPATTAPVRVSCAALERGFEQALEQALDQALDRSSGSSGGAEALPDPVRRDVERIATAYAAAARSGRTTAPRTAALDDAFATLRADAPTCA